MAETLAVGIEEKCQITDKLCEAKEEYTGNESSLENGRLEKESFKIPRLTDSSRKVKKTNMILI